MRVDRRLLVVLALGSVAFAYAYLMQGAGRNQGSHYALVRALADGTPRIDKTQREIGDLDTADIAPYKGHVYSDKAPGLAFATLPAYLLVEQTGAHRKRDPTRALWLLSLAGAVVPAILLLLLVVRVVDEVEPRTGLAAAVTIALGTLLFPYATVLYAHALSALLGFAAFAAVFESRRRSRPLLLVALGGVCGGLAIVVEYPLAIVAAAVGAYALANGDRLRRGLGYAVGVVVGVLPLLIYNQWAFGSPTHLSYASSVFTPEGGEIARGFDFPRPHTVFDVLFGPIGLWTFAPVLACALAGLVLVYRHGHRAEALTCAAVFFLDLFYISGYFTPFGGGSAGPRYFIAAVGFLALGLGAAYRAAPAVTALLGAGSVAVFAVVTATHPIAASDRQVLERLTSGGFAGSFLQLQPKIGSLEIVPFFAAALVGFAAALWASQLVRPAVRTAAAGIVALAAWGAVALITPELVLRRETAADVLVVVLAVVAVAAVLAAARRVPDLPVETRAAS